MFLENPVPIQPDILYSIRVNFEIDTTEQSQDWPAYGIQYDKMTVVQDHYSSVTFYEDLCGLNDSCKIAYAQSGHVRFLYFWPVYFNSIH